MSGELIETSESSRTHDRGKPHQFVKSHERINIGKLLISAFQKKSEKVKFLAGYIFRSGIALAFTGGPDLCGGS